MRLFFRGGLAAAALSSLVPAAPASAELMIAPTRVMLQPSQRTAELVLVNRGTETAAFRLQVENRRMREDGSLEAADAARPGELFAADKVRFAPRQLVLEPGARQTVRVTAALPEGLPAGEYRSHLRLMSAPTSVGKQDEGQAGDDRALSIELIAVRSLTIPVLVRVGTLEANAQIEGARFSERNPEQLVIRMTRTGTRSTYGDIQLTLDGERTPAYTVRGIAIYAPNSTRDVILPLPLAVRQKLGGRMVKLTYVSTDPAAPGAVADMRVQL